MKEFNRWLQIADEDLRAARGLLEIELFSSSTYHSQQCAEKSLKAFLAFKDQPITKTHDLGRLLELCSVFDVTFEKVRMGCVLLSPYATKFRYPSEYEIPTLLDAQEAIYAAEQIFVFVRVFLEST